MGECFEFRDAFPPSQDVIEALCQRNGEATHDAIVRELIRHKTGSLVVEDAVARCPQRNKEGMASNMVQWLSQQYEKEPLRDFRDRFERRQINKKWAYARR